MHKDLESLAADAAAVLQEQDDLLVISHYDCDGIASAVVAHEMLDRNGIQFTIRFVDELNEEKLAGIVQDHSFSSLLFTDIGSGQADAIRTVLDLDETPVVIADHHEPQDRSLRVDAHVNPHLAGLDGESQVSGAGTAWFVADAMTDATDLLPYAIVGATGDIQKDDGEYLGLNKDLVDKAQENGLVEVKQGLKLYGRTTKDLVTALKYTTDPYLDGISNDESGTIHFLNDIGIPIRDRDGGWRSLADLSQDEEQQLIHGLITRGYDNIEELIGTVYIMENGWEVGEFASLLNACGRLERPEAGLPICLEDDFDLAWKLKEEYGRRIGRYLGFIEDNRDNGSVIEYQDDMTLIKAGSSIDPHMIGTVTTICAKSGKLDGSLLIGMAEKGDHHLKLSARLRDGVDGVMVNEVMEAACSEVDGEGGGHAAAAGGKIPRENQERFIKVVRDVLTDHRAPGTE